MMGSLSTHPLGGEIRLLLRAALAIFSVTVVIGILNGTDVTKFSHEVVLAHVHAGTLGWITLCVFAATFWLFGDDTLSGWRASLPAPAAWLAVVGIAAYVLAFALSTGVLRPVVGTVTLAAIVAFFVWALAQARAVELSIPRLGLLVALVTSVTGGVFGVLWGILVAYPESRVLPDKGVGAHPAAMVVGFLVPVGMALAEWWLRPEAATRRAPRRHGLGVAQFTLLFVGGLLTTVGVLVSVPPLLGIGMLLEIVALVFFFVRLGGPVVHADWLRPGSSRFFAVSAFAIGVNILFLFGLIGAYAGEFEKIPRHLVLAMDHIMFVGVMTNALFGFLYEATSDRRALWPWADNLIFWLTDLGLLGFVVGLLANAALPKRIFTPLMGVGIILGIVTYLARLQAATAEAPGADRVQPTPA